MKRNSIAIIITAIGVLSSCNSLNDNNTISWGEVGSTVTVIPSETESTTGIPSASDNAMMPTIMESDITVSTIPSVAFEVDSSNSDVVNISMGGIQSLINSLEYLTLYGTGDANQNVWLEIDGVIIGFIVENASSPSSVAMRSSSIGSFAKLDLVFTVDNSGSMSDEANTLATQIIDWSNTLSGTMDVQFGCVGYNSGVNGAVDLTDATTLSDYLNLNTGTSRTVGYHSNITTDMESDASNYYTSGECGATGIRYADANFSWRSGANRFYVNLTDEPNQWSTSNYLFSAESFNETTVSPYSYDWSGSRGSVHTVMSGSYSSFTTYSEDPFLISDYTGGSTKTASSDYSDVNLSDLPVTGSILNSFLFKIDYTPTLSTGTSTLTITIKDTATGIIASNNITITF